MRGSVPHPGMPKRRKIALFTHSPGQIRLAVTASQAITLRGRPLEMIGPHIQPLRPVVCGSGAAGWGGDGRNACVAGGGRSGGLGDHRAREPIRRIAKWRAARRRGGLGDRCYGEPCMWQCGGLGVEAPAPRRRGGPRGPAWPCGPHTRGPRRTGRRRRRSTQCRTAGRTLQSRRLPAAS